VLINALIDCFTASTSDFFATSLVLLNFVKLKSKSVKSAVCLVIVAIELFIPLYPPANTLDDPAATDVQPLTPSPTLPAPFPFTLTVDEPDAIGAACEGHGAPGSKCPVFTSPWRDHGMLFTNTLGLPTALVIPEQCGTSASPILVAAGISFSPHQLSEFTIVLCNNMMLFVCVRFWWILRFKSN
jgi:hypothetical protein